MGGRKSSPQKNERRNDMNTLIDKLIEMKESEDNALRLHVIEYILDNCKTDEEVKGFAVELMTHGCQSGLIGHLIYYHDTHKFFDKYYEEIEELRWEYESSTGEPFIIGQDDLKNKLAWFGFEETAYNIFNELNVVV